MNDAQPVALMTLCLLLCTVDFVFWCYFYLASCVDADTPYLNNEEALSISTLRVVCVRIDVRTAVYLIDVDEKHMMIYA